MKTKKTKSIFMEKNKKKIVKILFIIFKKQANKQINK